MISLPNLAQIREAIHNAPPKPAGFPLAGLRTVDLESDYLRALLAQIEEEAERALATPIPALSLALFRLFGTTGDRAQYERVYFDRRRRMAALALGAHTSQSGEAREQRLTVLGELLWEICNEYTWALPAHLHADAAAARANRLTPDLVIDLFAAETAAALAEILALCGDHLDPWLAYRIRHEVERRIFTPLFDIPERFHWESAQMNWAAVCAGSAGIAALALEENRERLAYMIDRVLRALESFLAGFPNDGGTPEGIVYWEYGFGFYLYLAEALYDYTGGALNLLAGEQIKRIATFPNVVALGNDRFVNFSDANLYTRLHSGIGARLRSRLGIELPPLPPPDFYTDHIFRWAHVARDLVWSEVESLTAEVVDGSFYLPELAWVVDRRRVNGTTLAFAAKGGNNDEPHNHNDLGHFILHVGDESLLADVGAGRYSRQYFGPERYESIHNGAQGHSVPVVGGAQQRARAAYRAAVIKHTVLSNGVRFWLDLTQAYPVKGVESLVRAFEWQVDDGGATLSLTDTLIANAPLAFGECFISLCAPVLEETGEDWRATWRGKMGEVALSFSALAWLPTVEVVETEDHFGKPFTVHRLLLRCLQPATHLRCEFAFRCTPHFTTTQIAPAP